MNKKITILIAICLFTAASAMTAAAQEYNRVREQRVTLVKGKKLVLKGEVRDSDEIAYTLKANRGQRLTVRVIGRDADFSVNSIYEFGPEPLVENTRSWTGTIPDTYYKKFEIVVHSNYKVANFRLEITLN